MKKVIARRKRDKAELEEEDALVTTYLHAVQDEFDFAREAAE